MKKKLLCLLMVLAMLVPCVTVIGNAKEPDYIISGEGILPFKDISDGAWYYPSTVFCYANGIIKGQGNEYTFAANATLTRATFAVMLARVLGADLDSYEYKGTFKDCLEGTWYTPSVEWAHEMGYVMGTGDGTAFSPSSSINREQGATMLARVLNKNGYDISKGKGILDDYTDKASVSPWAVESVECIISEGIMKSTSPSDSTFSPKMTLTRAQSVVIFHNFIIEVLNLTCRHEYTEADCTSGKTCNKCGLVFSLPNGHYCENLSCKEGGVCITCGEEVAADPALHKYSVGNCTTPGKCSVCGDVRKAATGHKFTSATCTAPRTCSVCKATEGSALGHTTNFGICTRCNGEVFASKFLRAAYYMVEKAEPNGKGVYTDYAYFIDDEGGLESGILYYDANVTKFGLGFNYVWSDDYLIVIAMEISQNTNTYKYQIGYYDPNHNLLAESTGYVDAPTLKYTVSSHSGSSQYWSWVDSLTVALVESSVAYGDYLLDHLCGEDASIFGF